MLKKGLQFALAALLVCGFAGSAFAASHCPCGAGCQCSLPCTCTHK